MAARTTDSLYRILCEENLTDSKNADMPHYFHIDCTQVGKHLEFGVPECARICLYLHNRMRNALHELMEPGRVSTMSARLYPEGKALRD